jgi:hypothetical protein
MASFLFRRSLATRASTTHRVVVIQSSTRNTSTSAAYGISALSNRHETQHFHRLSRLPLMEHSPTLKLIHTSEVAAGAPSAPFSSSTIDSSARQEDQPMQDGSAWERTNMKPIQGPREVKNERDLSSVVEEYRKEIQGLNKRLDSHTLKLVELQQIVEKRTEHGKSESDAPSGTGRHRSKEEDDERGPISYVAEYVAYFLTGVGCYLLGRYQAESIYHEKEYYERQKEQRNSAPAPLKDYEDLEFKNKAQIRVTVERIIDGVSDKNHHANAGTEQSDATESESQLAEPDRSWSSLFWRKR